MVKRQDNFNLKRDRQIAAKLPQFEREMRKEAGASTGCGYQTQQFLMRWAGREESPFGYRPAFILEAKLAATILASIFEIDVNKVHTTPSRLHTRLRPDCDSVYAAGGVKVAANTVSASHFLNAALSLN